MNWNTVLTKEQENIVEMWMAFITLSWFIPHGLTVESFVHGMWIACLSAIIGLSALVVIEKIYGNSV